MELCSWPPALHKGRLRAQKSWGGPEEAAGWGGLTAQPLRLVHQRRT